MYLLIFPKSIAHPDSKVHGANMGPPWVLSAPEGPHVGPMNLAIRAVFPGDPQDLSCQWSQLSRLDRQSPWQQGPRSDTYCTTYTFSMLMKIYHSITHQVRSWHSSWFFHIIPCKHVIMTWKCFYFTGPFLSESISHWWIVLTKIPLYGTFLVVGLNKLLNE